MNSGDIRKKYFEFMEERGHAVIPSASLTPENDPTTLFTGSGMQSLIPYLMGETHPVGTRLANSQKCFRAEDIEEVGDNRHTTFFEMLGNWSLGDYFKEEQLPWFFSFLVDEVGLNPENIYVTVFAGDENAQLPKDEEAVAIWQKLFAERSLSHEVAHIGSEEEGSKRGIKDGERIFYYNAKKNWWSRAGTPEQMPVGEIGGPDSEVFYDFGTPHDQRFGAHCHPNCDCGRFLEIGNSVFMEYMKKGEGQFEKLPKRNVDFGGGLERIAAAKNGDADMFNIDLLATIITKLEALSSHTYAENPVPFRVVADHMRAAVFLIGDGVYPGNKDQQYFVRRLLRRSVRYADLLELPENTLEDIAEVVIETYGEQYPNLGDEKEIIIEEIQKEETQFRKTLQTGLKEFNKASLEIHLETKEVGGKKVIDTSKKARAQKAISAKKAFDLFTTYGFPIELTEEIAKEKGLRVDRKGFEKLMEEHREKSRAGAEQKFKGGLADHSDAVVAYHTATHLLLAGLRKYLGEHVHQAGSNITAERLRFDFTHPEKVPEDVLKQVEEYVNTAIAHNVSVTIETMDKQTAQDDSTVEGSFWEKYPDQVKVYTIKDDQGVVYSRELCGGPHVENTGHIKGTFKITKEESSARGIRRVKAVLEE